MRKIVWEVADESVREGMRLQGRARQIAYQGVESVPLKKIELSRFGSRIRRERELLGLSQEGFAIRCGLNRSYLGGVERGDRNLTFGVLCAICEGLTCDIAAVTKGIPRLPS
jgi:ribosome-binding protein aMBF1 (putative translation factor)